MIVCTEEEEDGKGGSKNFKHLKLLSCIFLFCYWYHHHNPPHHHYYYCTTRSTNNSSCCCLIVAAAVIIFVSQIFRIFPLPGAIIMHVITEPIMSVTITFLLLVLLFNIIFLLKQQEILVIKTLFPCSFSMRL